MTHNRTVNVARGYIYSKIIVTSGCYSCGFFSDTIVTSSKEQLYSYFSLPSYRSSRYPGLSKEKALAFYLLFLAILVKTTGKGDPVQRTLRAFSYLASCYASKC